MDDQRLEGLLADIYDELRSVAGHLRRRHGAGDSVRATSLVHEAWLRLAGSTPDLQSPQHLAALAARVMRNVLVDRARAATADKRGGGWDHVALSDVPGESDDVVDIVALDAALTELAAFDARGAEIVQLRFFGGLSPEEVADVLGISRRTAERDWRAARAWLADRLG